MLRIKLVRHGKNKMPFYRIIVAEDRKKITASPAAYLGYYDAVGKKFTVDRQALQSWISKGAIPTTTVAKLCRTS